MLNPYSDHTEHDDYDIGHDEDAANNIHYPYSYSLPPSSHQQQDTNIGINNYNHQQQQRQQHITESPRSCHLPLSYNVIDSSPQSSISSFSCSTGGGGGGGAIEKKEYVSLNSITPQIPESLYKKEDSRPRLKPRSHHSLEQKLDSGELKPIAKSRATSPSNSQDGSQNSMKNRRRRNKEGQNNNRHHRRTQRSDELPPSSSLSLARGATSTRKKLFDHRRTGSASKKRSIKGIGDEARLSTLQEDRQNSFRNVAFNSDVFSQSSKDSTQPQQQKQYHLPSKELNPLPHRRTVSFPDQVLQKGATMNGLGSPNNKTHRRVYTDLIYQSNDPALYSMLPSMKGRSNGRVCIPFDVEPSNSNNMFHSLNDAHFISPTGSINSAKYNARKHRRGKSGGSGSLSSIEQKLVRQVEEINMQYVDEPMKLEKKRAPMQQVKSNEITEVHSDARKSDDKNHLAIEQRGSLNDDKNKGKQFSMKKNTSLAKIRERKSRRNMYNAQSNSLDQNFKESNDHSKVKGKSRKNKEGCVLM